MKKIILFSLFAMALATVSCNKDEEPTPTPTPVVEKDYTTKTTGIYEGTARAFIPTANETLYTGTYKFKFVRKDNKNMEIVYVSSDVQGGYIPTISCEANTGSDDSAFIINEQIVTIDNKSVIIKGVNVTDTPHLLLHHVLYTPATTQIGFMFSLTYGSTSFNFAFLGVKANK